MNRYQPLLADAKALLRTRSRSLTSSWSALARSLVFLVIILAGAVSEIPILELAGLVTLSFIAVERMALLLLADRRLSEVLALINAEVVDADAVQLLATRRRLSVTAVIWTAILLVYGLLVIPDRSGAALALSIGPLAALFHALWLPDAKREQHLAHYGTPLRPSWEETEQARRDMQTSLAKLRTKTATLQERTQAIEVERDEAMGEWMKAEDAVESERQMAQDQTDQLSERVVDLLERLRLANDRLPTDLRIPEDGAMRVDDAGADLIRAVRSRYIERFGAEAETAPLAPIRIGWAFMEAMRKSPVSKAKVIDVVGEVASRKAWRMDGRQVHRLRSGTGAEAAPVIRARDGAKAYRCALKRGMPSAPRLHWWELSDGAIELATIVLHDDFSMPE